MGVGGEVQQEPGTHKLHKKEYEGESMRVEKSFKEKFEKMSAPKQNKLLVDAIVKNCIACCGGVKSEAIDCPTKMCAMKDFNFLVKKTLIKD